MSSSRNILTQCTFVMSFIGCTVSYEITHHFIQEHFSWRLTSLVPVMEAWLAFWQNEVVKCLVFAFISVSSTVWVSSQIDKTLNTTHTGWTHTHMHIRTHPEKSYSVVSSRLPPWHQCETEEHPEMENQRGCSSSAQKFKFDFIAQFQLPLEVVREPRKPHSNHWPNISAIVLAK